MNKLYIIVRNDLDPGLQAAQAVHALAQFMYYCYDAYREWFYGKDWYRPQDPHGPNNIVLLQVPDEAALKKLAYSMTHEPVELATFEEPDLQGQLTAIACGGEGIERFVSNLPLALRQLRLPKAA